MLIMMQRNLKSYLQNIQVITYNNESIMYKYSTHIITYIEVCTKVAFDAIVANFTPKQKHTKSAHPNLVY